MIVLRVLMTAAVALLHGCESAETAPPRLPPRAYEQFRMLIGRSGDAELAGELQRHLDMVQAEWPRRDAAASPGEGHSSLTRLRESIRRVPDPALAAQMYELTEVLAAARRTGADGEADWFLRPDKVRVDSLTRFMQPEDGPTYLTARVQVLDADGHPMRAIGKFRIELYEVERQAGDPRGRRIAWWNVDVQQRGDNTKHYDHFINGYTFNLSLEAVGSPAAGGRYVLEAGFIRPDGTRVPPLSYHFVESTREESHEPLPRRVGLSGARGEPGKANP